VSGYARGHFDRLGGPPRHVPGRRLDTGEAVAAAARRSGCARSNFLDLSL
jgi:hypothetical protein